jgi:hypothetical protein
VDAALEFDKEIRTITQEKHILCLPEEGIPAKDRVALFLSFLERYNMEIILNTKLSHVVFYALHDKFACKEL